MKQLLVLIMTLTLFACGGKDSGDSAKGAMESAADAAKEAAGDTMDAASDAMEDAQDAAGEMADDAMDAASGAMDEAKDAAGDMADGAMDAAKDAMDEAGDVEDMLMEKKDDVDAALKEKMKQ
ncbi:MAG: hypothetical protein KJO95_05350 [Gammaproteobacteria bacterium]|nr:hypothetical protein [Gammaproteobacteria bacterium]MBU2676855.1 hypothetical protein [Gammaproteobacteria bacterium]NNC58237.1 hypothetical protein [Woeseiaceae bacterium]NNL50589.1 hypothetical protein [Woeseiaceae bacterium]